VPLQAYLHRIGKMESPTCLKCRRGDETVEHYLMTCKAFAVQWGCMERHLRKHEAAHVRGDRWTMHRDEWCVELALSGTLGAKYGHLGLSTE